MNDDQIEQRGGTDRDIREYSRQNGADLTEADISEEQDKEIEDIVREFSQLWPSRFLGQEEYIRTALRSYGAKEYERGLAAGREEAPGYLIAKQEGRAEFAKELWEKLRGLPEQSPSTEEDWYDAGLVAQKENCIRIIESEI